MFEGIFVLNYFECGFWFWLIAFLNRMKIWKNKINIPEEDSDIDNKRKLLLKIYNLKKTNERIEQRKL